MNAERYRQIDRLFDAVLDRPDGEREAYLVDACGQDHALRAAVLDLLDAEVESRELDSTDADRAVRDARRDALGGMALPRFGSYRAIERLGQGGMGDVYAAEREGDYERRVAIKVIRRGMTESDALRERFHRERQILARLEHPNIAGLYDGGTTEDGRPWLAMEWIDGLPIDGFCDHYRLGIGARIALFLQLCGAVEHAHRHLLVHRDLKPANILVTRAADTGLRLSTGLHARRGKRDMERPARFLVRPPSSVWGTGSDQVQR
ncbi:MAG: serine/threonine-protein kinase, partial [Acidobacteriota bacterium]